MTPSAFFPVPADVIEAIERVLAARATGRVTGAVNLGDPTPEGANALAALADAFGRWKCAPTHDEAWNM